MAPQCAVLGTWGAEMTRRDFNLIAEIIRNLPLSAEGIKMIAWRFAKGLKSTNPMFDTERFITACEKPND